MTVRATGHQSVARTPCSPVCPLSRPASVVTLAGVAELDDLIDDLAHWRTSDDYYDAESARDRAIRTLAARGPAVVPVLVARLDELLAERARHEAAAAALKSAWDTWYARMDQVGDEAERQGRVATEADFRAAEIEQPPSPDEVRAHRDPYQLRQGIVQALHQLGDQRAAPVLVAALADSACVWYAALALRDIRAENPVGPLMDGLVRTARNGTMTDEIAATIIGYGVSPETVVARFTAEPTAQGRVNLMELLADLAAGQDVSAEAFLAAAGDELAEVRWAATDGLARVPRTTETEHALLLMALDPEESVRWRAISALRRVRGAGGTAIGGSRSFPLTEDLVREAVGVRDGRVQTRVQSLLTELDDPMPVLRALHSLAAGDDRRAGAALLDGEALFRLMLRDGTAAEANAVFESVAGPADVTRFEQFKATQPKQRRRWFRRR